MHNLSTSAIIVAVSLLVIMPICLGIVLELTKHNKRKESPPPDEPKAPSSTVDLSRLLLETRWLLLPFYLGMVVTVGVYLYKFVMKLVKLINDVHHISDQELMLRVLYLLDTVMVANLLMYAAIGSFAYFVRQFQFNSSHERPGMLGHLDGTTLKMKLGMALIGVSSIHLLEAYIDSANVSTEQLTKLIAIHIVFVFSTVAIAWIRTLPGGVKPSDNHS